MTLDDETIDGDFLRKDLERSKSIQEYSLGALVKELLDFEILRHRIVLNEARGNINGDIVSLKHQLEVRLVQLYNELDERERRYLKR